jgi:PAS domain S-box-containing protein
MREPNFPRLLAVLSLLAVCLVLVGGVWFYRAHNDHLRHGAEAQLAAIARLKMNEIANWRAERLAHAGVLMESPLFIGAAAAFLISANREDSVPVLTRFKALCTHYKYHDALLVDPSGAILLRHGQTTLALHPDAQKALSLALGNRRAVLTDLHTAHSGGSPHLGVVFPVIPAGGGNPKPLGAVILLADAGQFLYPLVQSWPIPSQSAETLILRKEDKDVLFLNELRHQKNTALKLRIPISRVEIPAVMAVSGKKGLVQGKDYRGVDVLAYIGPVPGSNWHMVSKVDTEEIFSEWNFLAFFILSTTIALVLAIAALAGLLWQQGRKVHYKELARARGALLESEERYRATLMGVGDAVIATDAGGLVSVLNPAAAALTGWSEEEAKGRPVEEVFHIINEYTRQKAENPVARVLREGLVVALANHTLLVAKDGTERPIADSGAPIKDEESKTAGVVLVFRDQTAERAAEKALRDSEASVRRKLAALLEPGADTATLRLEDLFDLDSLNSLLSAFHRATGFLTALLDRDGNVLAAHGWQDICTRFHRKHPETRQNCVESDTLLAGGAEPGTYTMYRCKNGLWDMATPIVVGDIHLGNMYFGQFFFEDEPLDREEFLRAARRHGFDEKAYMDALDRVPKMPRETAERLMAFYARFANTLAGLSHANIRLARARAQEDILHESLRKNQEQFRIITENMRDTVWLMDMDLATLYISPSVTRTRGYTLEELQGMTLDQHVTPASLDILTRAMEEELAPERLADKNEWIERTLELEFYRKDGSIFWSEITMTLVRDAEGKPSGFVGVGRDISGRKAAEDALRASEEKFRLAFQTCPDSVSINRARDGMFVSVNTGFRTITGYTEEEVLGKTSKEMNIWVNYEDRLKVVEEVTRSGKIHNFESRFYTKSGKIFGLMSAVLIELNGEPHIINITRDITERKRIEEALKESERKFRSYVEQAPDGIFVADGDGVYVDVNAAGCALTGYSREELIGIPLMRLVPEESRDLARRHFRQTAETGQATMDIPSITKDGERRLWTVKAVKLSETAYLGFVDDITEKKRAEEKISALARLVAESPVVAFRWLPEPGWPVDYVSENVRRWGYDPDAFLSRTLVYDQIVHPEDMARVEEEVGKYTAAGANEYVQIYRVLQADRETRWVEDRTTVVRRRDGRILHYQGVVVDVTERKSAEEALRRRADTDAALAALSAELLKPGAHVTDIAPILMEHAKRLTQSAHGYTATVDSKTGNMLALSLTEMLGKDRQVKKGDMRLTFSKGPDGLYPALWGHALNTRQAFYTNAPKEHPSSKGLPDGHVPITRFLSIPVIVEETLLGQICVANAPRDYTDDDLEVVRRLGEMYGIFLRDRQIKEALKENEAQLRQAQKMEAVGRLAGGIAHDFNNMLNVITGHAEMALLDMSPKAPLWHALIDIQKAASRSADLTRQLLAFARRQIIAPKVIDLNDAIEEILGMLGRLIGENIELLWQPSHAIGRIKIDPAQVHQLLANLIVNARDAISGPGKVTIETGNATLDAGYCENHPDASPGQYVMLAVSDNGCGMDKETAAHIFEPFYTTKETGKGTGLGCATVYGIVKQNNGSVSVYSEPGRGTVFRIYLPAHGPAPAAPAVTASLRQLPGGVETVLLVEDEPALLKLGKMTLERLGYTVLAAGAPGEALGIAKAHTGEIHLLITDVVMPGMSGKDLWERFRVIKPGAKCLYMSGYTENVIVQHGVLNEGVNFLEKPFTQERIANKLREVLDRVRI